jgi:hypothetical protein
MTSKQQQVNEIVDGLGLGMASVGVTRVSSSRKVLEPALRHAWSQWEHASDYPSIERTQKPENELWSGITRSKQRTNVAVVWKEGGEEYAVDITLYDATPEEAARFVSDRPLSEWKALAVPFLDQLEAGKVLAADSE